MKWLVVVTLASTLLGLYGYAFASSVIITSPIAFVTDGVDGFEELEGPKGITTVTIGSSTYALAASYKDDGVQIIDITDPYHPSPVAAVTDGVDGFEELEGARDITTATIGSSTYAIVTSSVDHGIQIINITNPSDPAPASHISSITGTYFKDPREVATVLIGSSTYALIAAHGSGVHIMNITDPYDPNHVASLYDGSKGFEALGNPRGITTTTIESSTYAVVAAFEGAVQIINITDPSKPTPVGAVHNSPDTRLGGATAVTVITSSSSMYALVAAQTDNAVQIIDITDLSNPDPVTFVQHGVAGFDALRYLETITTITFDSSTYALVTSFIDGIQIVDVTDPSSPPPPPAAFVSKYDDRFEGFPFPEDTTVIKIDSRTYAIVVSNVGNGVQIIDIDLTSGPVLASATLNEEAGMLEITFSDTVDVTPAGMVDLSGLTIRDAGQSVSLAGAILNTEVDSAAISIELTEMQGRLVATMASPRLDISDSAVIDTSGNLIELSRGNIITVNDSVAPEIVSAIIDGNTSILEITFSDRIDATPAFRIHVAGMTVRDSGQSVSLAGATPRTEVDSAVISIEMTEDQRQSIAVLASPLLDASYFSIVDTDGNPIEASSGNTITVKNVNQVPTVTSIERSDPVEEVTSEQTLVYEVTFSESVTEVDKTDFALSSDSTGGVSSAQFTQTRSPDIDITAANTITDTITVPDSGTVTSVSVAIDVSHTYISDLKIDLVAPDGTTKTIHNRSGGSTDDIDQTYTPNFAGVSIAGTWTLQINDDYAAADDGTLNSWTLTINPSSSSSDTSNPVTSISGSGNTYYVTVSATQDGTYNLDLVSSGHEIVDTANNHLTNTTPTYADHTYTVSTVPADTTAPTLSSIERYNPVTATTDSQTLIYEVTFSESVTEVDKTDFALSSDSTGGVSSAQFTQTRSPDIDITAANTITDTITVPDSGTVTSVSVAIDVSHTYISDLKIDLVAPDGTTKTIHNRSGGSTDDIDQTYTPNFAGVSIAGTWTLQINDDYAAADDGTLNSWTLTINPSSSSSDTSNPVTSISGSGNTYYVTVSATQDGTYNLDLVSSGHEIVDTANNHLTNTTPTYADHTYTVSTVPADTTAPTLSSIERYNPVTATTDSQTLIYEVTFSESVTEVDKTDFALSSDSTGGVSSAQFTQTRSPDIDITAANTITDTITVPDSGTVTSVSVAIDVSHTYISDLKIDLVAPDGTTKTIHNRSGGSTDDIDQTYTPNFAGVSIAGTWTLQINDDYAAADDGTLNSWTLTINPSSSSSDTSNPVTSISGSGNTYYVTVSATQDGTYNLDLVSSGHEIVDTANNHLTNTTPTYADHTYTVSTVPADTTAPTLSSIERYNPVTATTDSQTLIYEVTFSESVTEVDKTDFALSSDSTGGVSSAQFTQTRSPDIDITAANTITDTITVPDSGTVTSVSVAIDVSHTYISDLKIDLVAPDGTTKTIHNRSGGSTDDIDQTYTPNFAGVSIAGTWTLQINDDYAAADDGTLNSWTLTINPSSSSSDTSNPVTSISGSGNTYYVTVSATQDGTYNLDLVSSGHEIVDTANNHLTNTTPTYADHTYTVSTVPADTTAPTLSSIERYNPVTATTDSQTLIYEVTFSESVTEVDKTDFALSSDSTGGVSSAQFTQTRSPDIDITAANTITDTITVPDSGTVTSVSVAIDVSHTYISDLKIDLVAPDGTTKTIHNRSGGSTDDIDQTYTPNFAGVSIAGTWTLQINDDYAAADDGTLNSWTLTINPSSSSSSDTSNPVTSISGSGNTYYVTVSATQDGTYNLDLVSSGHDITDESSNPLTNTAPTDADHTYTVSTTG